VGDTTPAPSQQELSLIGFLAAGETDAAIARRLGITRRTLQRRLRPVLERLGAQSRFQAGVLAERAGWIPGEIGSAHPRHLDPKES
jgi:DNA-binding NarL/FixJ family response regulator